MMLRYGFVCACLIALSQPLWSQDFVEWAAQGMNFHQIQAKWRAAHPEHEVDTKSITVQSAKVVDEDEIDGEQEQEGEDLLFRRWEDYWRTRVLPNGDFPDPSHMLNESRRMREWHAQPKMKKAANQLMNNAPWKLLGPTTKIPTGGGAGRVNCIRINPDDMDQIWIGTPGGGLWMSTDLGVHWKTTTDSFPTLGISDIAFNPKNPQQMFIATGDGDGGNTVSYGVMKSDDAGKTWQQTSLKFALTLTRQTYRIVFNPVNPNILFCGTSNGLFRSTDNGTSWVSVQAGSMRDIEFKPDDPTVIYASSGGQIYRSKNGGSSFTRLTSGLSTLSGNRVALGVTPADPKMVYALVSNFSNGFGGLYRSTDAGDSWKLMSSEPTINILNWYRDGSYVPTDELQGQGSYDLSIAVSLTDPDKIYCGGVNVWTSEDGGSSWKIIAHWTADGAPYVHADIHSLELMPDAGTNILFAGTDGGVFVTQNDGQSWSDRSNGLQLLQFYKIGTNPSDPSIVIGGCQDNGTNLYSGGDWKNVKGADGMEAFFETGGVYAYCTIYYGRIWRSQNGGRTFQTEVTPLGQRTGSWVTPFLLNPLRQSTIYCGASAGIYRSTDRGDSWYAYSKSPVGNTECLAMSAADTSKFYATTSSRVWYSNDAGQTWKDVISNASNGFIEGIAADQTRGGVVALYYSGYVAQNKVFLSTNSGESWTNITKQGLPNVPVNAAVFYKNACANYLIIGTDLGVYFTTEDSDSWQALNNGLPNVVVRDMDVTNNLLHVGTYGRGLWEVALPLIKPIPAFRSNVTSVCAGDVVAFEEETMGSLGTISWSFEGGQPSSSGVSNPVITYPQPGTYTVSMRVTNSCGTDSLSKSAMINVRAIPAAPTLQRSINTLTCAAQGAKQWYFNGVLIAGATGDSYTVTTGGTYMCMLTDASGCSVQSAAFEVTELGVDDRPESPELSLFPNPADRELTIQTELRSGGIITCKVMTVQGRVVLSSQELATVGLWKKIVSVHDLAAGEYIVEIQAGNTTLSKRFIKNE